MMVLLSGDGTRQRRAAVKQSCHSLFIRAERRDVSPCKGLGSVGSGVGAAGAQSCVFISSLGRVLCRAQHSHRAAAV